MTFADHDKELIQALLQRRAGIIMNADRWFAAQSKLELFLKNHGWLSVEQMIRDLECVQHLALLPKLIDIFTVQETSFNRDHYPFEVLKQRILPEIHRKTPMAPLRIWSAGCATGQEAYSIAIVLEEIRRMHPSYFVTGSSVLATDISRSALEQAKQGRYDALSMQRGVLPNWKDCYFEAKENNEWLIKDSIKRFVVFQELNLKDDFSGVGKFDVIFCRNVLVYFAAEDKKLILNRFHSCLKPDGYLIVGSNEILSGVHHLFQVMQCNPGIVYKSLKQSLLV